MSGPGASSMEQGTTGPSGLAERVVHTNCVGFLDSYAPAWDSIHAANRYCVCVCMLSTGQGGLQASMTVPPAPGSGHAGDPRPTT